MSNVKKHFDLIRKKVMPPEPEVIVEEVAVVPAPAPEAEKAPAFKFTMPKINMPKMRVVKPDFSKYNIFASFSKFSVKKQTFFAKRLSFLIKAGVPMLESMYVLRKQTKSKSEIKVFNKVIADVANGQSLATSLGKFKGVFGNFAINIIKAGESSGTLTQNLNYLADELKKKEILRKKIMSALLYPIIITVATFGIVGLLVVYIFPKIMPIFQSLKADLPLSTRIIIYISSVIRNDGVYIFFGILVAAVISFLAIKRFPKAKFIFHGFILRVPLIGPIIKNYNLTNTTRTLGLLLKSGLHLTDSLLITADTTENLQYKKAYEEISKGVMKGKGMSDVLGKIKNIFPPMLTDMIAIGERSGNLSVTLIYLSEYYENEFEDQTKNLSSSIEPMLMIIMGILVGFVAISIITPIYGITQHLNPK